MKNYINRALQLKLLDDVEVFYLSSNEQLTLISMRIESDSFSLENLTEVFE